MATNDPWYHRDELWEKFAPIFFHQRRQEKAPIEVENMINLLSLKTGSHVLDLCCGIGRHTLEFARLGFQVTGVDRTQYYLDQAIKQAQAEGLSIEFIQDDMRNFLRAESFDAVINMFTAFGYFENPQDDRTVVKNAFDSLKPGGTFLIDVKGKEIVARTFQKRDWSEEEGYLVLQERNITQNWSWMESRWIVIKDTQRFEHVITLRLYSAVELSALLKECGFSDVKVYGNLEGSEYNQDSKRLVVIGYK